MNLVFHTIVYFWYNLSGFYRMTSFAYNRFLQCNLSDMGWLVSLLIKKATQGEEAPAADAIWQFWPRNSLANVFRLAKDPKIILNPFFCSTISFGSGRPKAEGWRLREPVPTDQRQSFCQVNFCSCSFPIYIP